MQLKNIKGFIQGYNSPSLGLKFIKQQPQLLKYCIIPIMINILVSLLIFMGLSLLVNKGVKTLSHSLPQAWWWTILIIIAFIIGISLSFFIVIFLFTTLLEIVNAPFLDYLSERVEKILFKNDQLPGRIQYPFFKLLYLEITGIFKKIFFLILINLKNLLWNLVPVIGPVLYLIFSYRDNLTLLGIEFFNPSLSLRMKPFKQRWQFAKKYRSVFIGAGTVHMLMILFPILKILIHPFAIVGGTITFVEIYKNKGLYNIKGMEKKFAIHSG